MRDEVMGEQHTLERGRWRAWDEFVESQTNTGFRQSSWYTAVKVASGWNHFGVVLRDGEAIVGGATVLTRTFTRGKMYYYIPDGPVIPNGGSDSDKGEIFRNIMEYLEGKRR